ncbi:MAG: copper resistance protein NlpE N-terminal domain-containing protein [Plesiomonas sp.]|uniref:copper resistance protein NlpE N-terminal domain-containing protein n=1 Tax=Plesiomonas sp. TaxID=2486279 RepID=UPI003F30D31C
MKANVMALSLLAIFVGSSAYAASHSVAVQPTTEVIKQADTTHSARNALDWNGTYQGVVPCASCEGIKTTLVLNADDTYKLTTEYLGIKENNTFNNKGKFTWNKAGNTVILAKQDENTQYFVGENVLFMLDRSGQRITGPLAKNYQLMKQTIESTEATNPLFTHRWVLTEVMGKKVPVNVAKKQQPFVEFSAKENRLHGFSGCNNFMGSYTLNAQASRISFSPLGMTRKACMDANFEQPLMQVFAQVDNYSLSGDILTLNKARMAPLAIFKAADQVTEDSVAAEKSAN